MSNPGAQDSGGELPAAPRRQRAGLVAGLLAFALVLGIPGPEALSPGAQRTAAVAILMAVWWVTEALPLAATALLPLALFPVLGVLSPAASAAPYANPVIFLFLGGFLLALAMERWGLHRRVALAVVRAIGPGPRRLVLGLMSATALVSMWVSNTATAAMMLPVGIAIAELLRPRDPGARHPFATALMLGIAYGASIGGLATLIGTPPNLVFAAAARQLLGREVGFLQWMAVGLPLALVLLPLAWALLVYVLYRPEPLGADAAGLLEGEWRALGPVTRGERNTMAVFGLTVTAWVLREPKTIGAVTIPGLTRWAPGLDDSTIAVAGALLLFLLPADPRRGVFTMDWATARRVPWGILLLFGGGLSLAEAFEETGLAEVLAGFVARAEGMPAPLLLVLTAGLFILLSEFASNTAVASLGMPVLAAAAAGVGADPLALMACGALASSTAFMLPVGTPPNAIVFGTGYITMGEMVRAGAWMDLASALLVAGVVWLVWA